MVLVGCILCWLKTAGKKTQKNRHKNISSVLPTISACLFSIPTYSNLPLTAAPVPDSLPVLRLYFKINLIFSPYFGTLHYFIDETQQKEHPLVF